ncbi:hypothetical protein OG203_43390 [Nocardia sp. NBC_01499]|uniref:hypothetical protein n=1 Tax=Nocardia sp. NBC_01499 TaxID=2903597 RepID=UPI00386BA99F
MFDIRPEKEYMSAGHGFAQHLDQQQGNYLKFVEVVLHTIRRLLPQSLHHRFDTIVASGPAFAIAMVVLFTALPILGVKLASGKKRTACATKRDTEV